MHGGRRLGVALRRPGSVKPMPRPSSPAPHAGQVETPSRKASPRAAGGLFGVSAAQPTVSRPRPRTPPPSSRVSVVTSLLRASDAKTNLGGLQGGTEADPPLGGRGGRPLRTCQSTSSGRRRAFREGGSICGSKRLGSGLWEGFVKTEKMGRKCQGYKAEGARERRGESTVSAEVSRTAPGSPQMTDLDLIN